MGAALANWGIRGLHVLSATVLVSGALVITALLASDDRENSTIALRAAAAYEVASWIALGALVMTGVGNLAMIGAGLDWSHWWGSAWGVLFRVKLAAIVLLLVVSALRTTAIGILLSESAVVLSGRRRPTLKALYWVTLLLALAIAIAGVTLAHRS